MSDDIKIKRSYKIAKYLRKMMPKDPYKRHMWWHDAVDIFPDWVCDRHNELHDVFENGMMFAINYPERDVFYWVPTGANFRSGGDIWYFVGNKDNILKRLKEKKKAYNRIGVKL